MWKFQFQSIKIKTYPHPIPLQNKNNQTMFEDPFVWSFLFISPRRHNRETLFVENGSNRILWVAHRFLSYSDHMWHCDWLPIYRTSMPFKEKEKRKQKSFGLNNKIFYNKTIWLLILVVMQKLTVPSNVHNYFR